MARIEVFTDRVVIKLSAAERTLAMRRRDIVLSRERITSALITDDPWVWLRGVRSPGAHLPTKLAIGTWRGFGGNDFCLIPVSYTHLDVYKRQRPPSRRLSRPAIR